MKKKNKRQMKRKKKKQSMMIVHTIARQKTALCFVMLKCFKPFLRQFSEGKLSTMDMNR